MIDKGKRRGDDILEHFIIEILSPFEAPSEDAGLVIFSDGQPRLDRGQASGHLRECADYARRHTVYLVSAQIINRRNLCLCLFSPKGKAVCRQSGIHLAMTLRGELLPGDDMRVSHTEYGNLCLCVDADIEHPQIARAAALKGADVLLAIQSLDPAMDTADRLMRTAWNAAQTNNLYVVSLSAGGCAVACPAPVTRARDGWILRQTAALPTRFALNMERLDEVRAGFDLVENINTRLVETYAEQLGR